MAESTRAAVLVVDDAPTTLEVLRRVLEGKGYRVVTAASVAHALEALTTDAFDLVVTDLKMPEASGMELVRHVHDNLRDTAVMMITGYATVEGAVQAVKGGAVEYLSKPFTNEEFVDAVARALDTARTRRVVDRENEVTSFQGLIGKSPAMRRLYRDIQKAAQSEATVLVTGESGTGKELVARAVHYTGARSQAPFVPVNCGAIPEGLMESELFGYVKGAFTGATTSRAGFFQTADGGTVFLDEIGEMSPDMQVRLLRVLQDRTVYMVGSSKPRAVNVRIVAASNKDLPQLVSKGRFREDLYFRLNVLHIHLPPLRDRGDDILLLVGHFAEKFSREHGGMAPEMSADVLESLRGYGWPGNVRELENVVQRLVVMSDGERIDVPDLPTVMRFHAVSNGERVLRPLADVEREHIERVLAAVDGNKTRAAEVLGIDRKTLRSKLERPS